MIRIIEKIQSYLKHLNESLAECAEAMTETGTAMTQLADVSAELRQRFIEMHDEQREMNARLNRYLDDQQKQDETVRKLQSEVREKLKVSGG